MVVKLLQFSELKGELFIMVVSMVGYDHKFSFQTPKNATNDILECVIYVII